MLSFGDEYLQNFFDSVVNTEIRDNRTVPSLSLNYSEAISLIVDLLLVIREEGNKIFFIGNGGSAAIASHMTADYMKNGRINTCNLYDNAVMTCLSNDYGYDMLFSKQIEQVGEAGDVIIAISSSGESLNIVRAVETAKKKNMMVISLTGFENENKVRRNSDISIYVPCFEYGIIESVHNLILQQIVDIIMKKG